MAEAEQTRDQLPDRVFMCTICGRLYEEDRGVGTGREWFREPLIGD